MQNLLIMDVLDSQSHLHEPIQNLVLTVANFAYFLLVGDLGVQITTISEVHHNAQAFFVHERLLVGDNVRMSHRFEDVDLVNGIFSLLPVHLTHVDDLHDISLSVSHRLNKDGIAETSLSNDF